MLKTTHSPAERHQITLQQLNASGHVTVADLSNLLHVSEVTVRKDLRQLEDHSLLLRTHGGAVRVDYYARDLPVEEKSKQHESEKKRIGEAAAALVHNGDSIILDAGTTTLQVARHLRGKKDVNVATNSIPVALEILRHPGVGLLMLGGLVCSTSASVVGQTAEHILREHSFQLLFLAGDGLDGSFGLTTTHALEAHLNRVMIENAGKTIVVVDSSKFGRRGLCRICGIDQIDVVITDDKAPETAVTYLEEHGTKVVIV
jgi:DeoR family transcriptional regulator, aga operon transcriptional repressor